MGRMVLLALLTAGLGCGGGAAPPPEPLEGGLRDGGTRPLDAGPTPPPGRSDAGLVLPPADMAVALPYQGAEQTEGIAVDARPQKLDVHLSVDTTQSFAEEINAMQAGLLDLVGALEAAVPDVSFGVSRFEDFPVDPFGLSSDVPFELLTPVTSDRDAVARAVGALDQPLGFGGDLSEAGAEALYQIATGDGRAAPYPIPAFDGVPATGGGTVGGVGFRTDALRVVVHVTDAPAHYPSDYGSLVPGTHSLDDAAQALVTIGARMVGIVSEEPGEFPFARNQLEAMAIATGATTAPGPSGCATGIGGANRTPVNGTCPLVFLIEPDGTGLSSALSGSILSLLSTVAYGEVHAEVTDDRFGFVGAVEAVSADPPAGSPAPTLTDAHPPGDSVLDTFVQVPTGTRLTFTVRLRNVSLPPADYDQAFRVGVRVLGDGELLAERVIRVVVPAAPPSSLDAGTGDGGMP